MSFCVCVGGGGGVIFLNILHQYNPRGTIFKIKERKNDRFFKKIELWGQWPKFLYWALSPI